MGVEELSNQLITGIGRFLMGRWYAHEVVTVLRSIKQLHRVSLNMQVAGLIQFHSFAGSCKSN